METDIKVTYLNKSMNKDLPTVFVFAKNDNSEFEELEIAWKVIPNINKKDNSNSFTLPFNIEANQKDKNSSSVLMTKSKTVNSTQERKENQNNIGLNCPQCNFKIKITLDSLLSSKIKCPSCFLEMHMNIPSNFKQHLQEIK